MSGFKKKRLVLTIRVLSIVILSYILIFPYLQSEHSNSILKDLRLINEDFLIKSTKLATLSKFISIYLTDKYREDEIFHLDTNTLAMEVNDLLINYINLYPRKFNNNIPQYQPLKEPVTYNFKIPHSGIEKINGNIDDISFLTSFEFILVTNKSKTFNIGTLKINTNLSNHPILEKVIISNEYSKNSQYSFYDQGLFNNIIIETFDVPIGENNTVPYYMSLGEVLKRDALVIFLILLLTLKFFIIKIGQQENKETNVRLNIATTELNKDALTGLLNRRHLSNLLKNENLDNYTITMIDGNKFKNINDTYGHSIGDLVIKHVANTLYTYTRHSDLVYRLGGDEFLILFLNMPGEAIDNLMAKINSILKKSIINEHTIPISISYGYAHICNYKCHEEALKMADDLLYRSKRSALETP